MRVQVLNEYEGQVDFDPSKEITFIAMELEKITMWEGKKIEMTCTVAPRDKLEVVVKDHETTRYKFAFLRGSLGVRKNIRQLWSSY